MKFIVPFLALTTLALAEPNTLTSEEKAAGWRLLFDGKTTEGWVSHGNTTFPTKGWVVEDGTLKHPAKSGGGHISTREQFEDFEFSWEWKIAPKANSGVKYNLVTPGKDLGCEYQLLDDDLHPDSKLREGTRTTGGLYDVLKPAADKKVKPPGEWNTSRLVVKGNHVEHWLNGTKVLEFEFGSDALKAAIAQSKFKKAEGWGVKTKSPLLLQDHMDEVSFRSLKILVLEPGN